jgi:hypothetical protein
VSADPDDRDQGREERLKAEALGHLYECHVIGGLVNAEDVVDCMVELLERAEAAEAQVAALKAAVARLCFVEAECEGRIAEADRLRAQVAEARSVLGDLVVGEGPWHDDDCPMDDTCDCSAKPLHDRINAVLAGAALQPREVKP